MADETTETTEETTQETEETTTSETTDKTSATSEDGKMLSQAEVDAIVKKRLAREKKAWEKQLEEERKKAAMTEQERLKAEKEEAEKKAQAAVEAANRRLIEAEAMLTAQRLGVNDVQAAIRLADFSEVEVGDDGSISGVEDALKEAIEAHPILKGTQVGPGKSGGEFNGNQGGGKSFTREQIRQMSPDEINANWEQIRKQMESGQIK